LEVVYTKFIVYDILGVIKGGFIMDKKRQAVWKVLLIEAVVVIAGLFAAIFITLNDITQFAIFIDLPTFLLMLLFVVPAFVASGLQKDFVFIFKISKSKLAISQLKRSLESIQLMQRLVLTGGFFSVFVALITCLGHLDNLSTLGPNMAVICLSGLYTVILEFLLLPLKTFVQVTLIEEMGMDNEEK